MAIAPSTTVRLINGVRLDKEYQNVPLFGTVAAQTAFFSGHTKRTYTQFTYQRHEGFIRVPEVIENILDCTYVMYNNLLYGSKNFYGFITKMEYVNDNTTAVYFEQDVFQTWMFDMVLMESFVEREHPNSDEIGENLVEENLELGQYVFADFNISRALGDKYKIVIASTVGINSSGEVANYVGGMYGNLYSGAYFIGFDTAAQANAWITTVTNAGKADGIISIFMLPAYAFTDRTDQPPYQSEITSTKITGNIDGYVPKNKKLFTWPYNFLTVSNNNGTTGEYRYEFFSGPSCTFKCACTCTPNPQAMLWPTNYKKVADNYYEKMVLEGWPQCSFNVDAYKAYLAQTAGSRTVGLASNAIQAIGGALTLNAGAALSGVEGIANILGKMYDASVMPAQSKGVVTNDINFALNVQEFVFSHTYITREYAKIIDDYFNMFGYATHEVKVPNTTGRNYWNYVKTRQCNIRGNFPPEHLEIIRDHFDMGVTFWHDPEQIGNYGLDNSPGNG